MSRGPANRRHVLGTLASTGVAPWLAACDPFDRSATWTGGWALDTLAAGHGWRDRPRPAPAGPGERASPVDVAVIGGGVAALAAARTLLRSGIEDVRVFELDTAAGGNARGHAILGQACPSGAHYLPQPGPQAREVRELLFDLGLLRLESGRTVSDERHLCHSPQERVFAQGRWSPGLLPPPMHAGPALAQCRRFAARVRALAGLGFAIPTLRAPWRPELAALDAETFHAWLSREGFDDPWLLAVLDYACRDDYGAGLHAVSAWAGLQYYASRHGFDAPGEREHDADPVFTWPQGNAWLTDRLAAPLGDRLQPRHAVLRLEPDRDGVRVHVAPVGEAGPTRLWRARQVIVCTPLFVTQRLLADVPAVASVLQAAARQLRWAPWLVTQLHLREPLLERVDTAMAWDNVPLQAGVTGETGGAATVGGLALPPGLGWVHAAHQSLSPQQGGPTVLTHYWALGSADAAVHAARRAALRQVPWTAWAEAVLSELAPAHPDVRHRVDRIELHRRGHAMVMPTPGTRGHPALQALARADWGRLHFAHADLSGYSIFEEAYTHGVRAGRAAARALGRQIET